MTTDQFYFYNLAQKFKDVARRFGDKPAIHTESDTVTYAELDQKSDQFAYYLLSNKLEQGEVLCIIGNKSVLTITCILGALKAGILYSVFDPETPLARLSKIFEKCKPRLTICSPEQIDGMRQTGIEAIDTNIVNGVINDFKNSEINEVAAARLQSITSSCPAYIMFTSGSTGFPKGATMTHQNVLNLIEWSIQTYGFTSDDVLTSVNPLFFDNSVFDIYSSLFSGASLALFDAKTVRDPAKLMFLLDKFKCTSWFSVPSMLIFLQTVRALTPTSFSHIRRIIFGGEGYPKAKLKELFDMFQAKINFYNVYGPTECTCICSSYRVSEADFSDLKGFLPLGAMAPNFDAVIVDSELKPVKDGALGELVLCGPNVGLGYYNDPERTEASFIQNPRHNSYRDIVYRTGDVVQFTELDQKFWISGRADNQIKHMGYRIELEEIENAISCIDNVDQCAVIHCEIRNLSHIIGFIKVNNDAVTEKEIRHRLTSLIPHYMIPTKFHFLNQLPKNANGKLDRKRLKTEYMEQSVYA